MMCIGTSYGGLFVKLYERNTASGGVTMLSVEILTTFQFRNAASWPMFGAM